MNTLRTVRNFCVVLAVGCAGETATDDKFVPDGDLEGIEEAAEGLTDLSGRCSFDTATKTVTCTLQDNDVAIMGLSNGSTSNSALNDFAVNGFKVTTTVPVSGAVPTKTTLQKLVINGSAGVNTVILDYNQGLFATGTSTFTGTTIDLAGNATDNLKLRGTPTVDSWVFGTSGIALNSDAFKDIVVSNTENFTVALNDGNDVFSGQGNAATGNAAFTTAVTVFGGKGNDTIKGGNGNDTLNGGDGADTFTTNATSDGNDTLIGGTSTSGTPAVNEIDVADYSLRTNALLITFSSTGGEAGETDVFSADIEQVKGGLGADTIVGDANANIISGGGGDDSITGLGGADTLNGDAGNDTFHEGGATNGADTFNGGAGTDLLNYGAGGGSPAGNLGARANPITCNFSNSTADEGESGELDKAAGDVENCTGGNGADTLTGSTGNNTLDGGNGIDTISGGAGDDTIRGGAADAAADILNGDAGNDRMDMQAAANGGDIVNCGTGVDLVDFSARTVALVITMDGTGADDGEGGENKNIKADCENLIGGSAADDIRGNALDNQLEGGSFCQIDLIQGLDGNDTLDGGGGCAGGSNPVDVLNGGNGEDINMDTDACTACEL